MTPGAGIFRTKLPLGFTAGGINCGVRNYRPDLGAIVSDTDCVAAGVFTQNTCKAAAISYCENLLPANNIRGILTNSGQANAATGKQGILDNQAMAGTFAHCVGCDPQQILTASTGVIGQPLAVDKINSAIPTLVNTLTSIAEPFAVAILTTDLVPKTVYKDVTLSMGTVCITGISKGSGMIHPNMATMLGYLLTDAVLDTTQAQAIVTQASNKSFNMISVDGESSTNDCVFLLANGKSQVALVTTEDKKIFYQAMEEISIILAKAIARDGEGASKLIEVTVHGTADHKTAKLLARSLTTSPLIKTAIYAASPNWGRIIARLGSQGIAEEMLTQCAIAMQGITLFSQGSPSPEINLSQLSTAMQQDTIVIDIAFSAGDASATAWGCDLTEKYVKINAEYLS
jgi:glutamate N-acetyltransferase / amino-acid N-acetyltransferase